MTSKVTAVSYLHSGVNDSAEIFLNFAYLHSGVNDSTVHFTAESMTRLCISQRSQWLRCAWISIRRENRLCNHSEVNDYAVHVSAEPMTPLCMSQRSHWLRCACHVLMCMTDSAIFRYTVYKKVAGLGNTNSSPLPPLLQRGGGSQYPKLARASPSNLLYIN
jgi:hypothetical protein